jgi:PucR C-terminal helix-turn-helix domain
VAWRRIARAAHEASVEPEVLSALAEAIFAYIDELSADSVEGYAQAQSELEGERQRRRRELVAMLLSEVPAARSDLEPAAALAAWNLPRTAAALACDEGDLGRIARRLPADVLAAPHQGAGCVVLPDPGGPGRRIAIAAAVEGLGAALGPSGQVAELAASWALARAALRAAGAGGPTPTELVMAEDRLAEVLVAENRVLIERIAERRLRPLEALTPAARTRLEKTALAYVQHGGNATAMARALHVHAQTVRYRMSRLRKLLAGSLDDPDGRFELEVALRANGVTVP